MPELVGMALTGGLRRAPARARARRPRLDCGSNRSARPRGDDLEMAERHRGARAVDGLMATMRLAVSLLAPLALLSGCYGPSTKLCPETGYLCREEDACKPAPVYCGEMPLIEACIGKSEFESCMIETPADGTCLAGTCTTCSPDLAGCAQRNWAAMTSPVPSVDLLAVFAFSNTSAYAAGAGGTFLTYDGIAWRQSEFPPPTPYDITSIWGRAADDLFVVTSTGALLHFDGSTWADVAGQLPAERGSLKEVAGGSSGNVLVVGLDRTVLEFGSSGWQSLSFMSPGPTLNAVAASDLAVAVGNGGVSLRVVDGVVTAGSPPPAPLAAASLLDVHVRGSEAVAVGALVPAAGVLTLLESQANGWRVAPQAPNLPEISLNGVWGDYCGGSQGAILGRHQGVWESMSPTPGDNTIEALWGTDLGEVFAVGRGGVIWRYTK